MAENSGDVDPVRTFSAEETRRLSEQLYDIVSKVHRGLYNDAPLCDSLICTFHRELFAGVRDHAGKLRSRGWGQERLVFGPNRSSDRKDVPKEVARLCERGETAVRSLVENASEPEYERDALTCAARWHAELIRIHPFEDGNGRTARIMLDYILVRLGLRPIAILAPRREYTDCLNAFFQGGDLKPLVDLFIGLL